MSLTIAKQYIVAYIDLHKKNPDIRIWRENKPKIRICQSGTDMQLQTLVGIHTKFSEITQSNGHYAVHGHSS